MILADFLSEVHVAVSGWLVSLDLVDAHQVFEDGGCDWLQVFAIPDRVGDHTLRAIGEQDSVDVCVGFDPTQSGLSIWKRAQVVVAVYHVLDVAVVQVRAVLGQGMEQRVPGDF